VSFGVAGVSVEFDGYAALDDISLEIPAGSVTAIVGGDGAGKSTLLRCLVGLVSPARGTVHRPPKDQIGYMPATSGTWRSLTVDENVDFIARSYGVGRSELAERRQQLLTRAALDEVGDREAGDLSGGMRQKLGFCLAMIHEPTLLVLDEPTTGVDVVSRVQLWRLIAEAATAGAAVVMATTYLDEAERAASVLVLDRGKQILAGEPAVLATSLPGSISETSRPGSDLAWRRGRSFHVWRPDEPSRPGHTLVPDLEDVVIAEMLEQRRIEPVR
jgi:ABC-2 type transport system ATP-binding protein